MKMKKPDKNVRGQRRSTNGAMGAVAVNNDYHRWIVELKKRYRATQIKAAIIANIERTLLSFGRLVSFVGKEYPVEIGGETKNIDLLFYIIPLHRYLVMEVKTTKYEPADLDLLVEVRREQTDDIGTQTYVGLENVNPEDGNYFGADEKESCSSALVFSRGQIVFPKLRPYLNKVWQAEFDGVASTEFIPLEVTGASPESLTTFLRMGIVAETMGILMTGNTLPRVQTKDVLSLPIPVPPKSVQERIVRCAGEIKAKARRLKATAAAQLAAAKSRIETELMEAK